MDRAEPRPIRPRRREPVAARRAYAHYERMEPGERSLERLAQMYQSCTESAPPTRHLRTLKEWSRAFDWQGRLAAEEARKEALRRRSADEVVASEAAARAERIEKIGSACLAVATSILKRFVLPDGTLNPAMVGRVTPRDLAPMIKAGVECVQLAAGAPTSITQQAFTPSDLDRVLTEADEPTRMKIVEGLRALYDMRRQLEHER